jgi:CHRD domain-containing protein
MRRDKLIKAVLAAALVVFSASYVYAEEFFARLNGFQEIGALNAETGAVRSNGTGTLHLNLDKGAGTATFTLTYSDVGTTAPKIGTVSQAHIHFGKRHVAGGVMVFFCATPPVVAPVAGTPVCPANAGTVTGTFTAASVVGPTAQNVNPGDFDALVDALESNTAYANIHTTPGFPAGEIRGQIHRVRRDNDDKHDDKERGR